MELKPGDVVTLKSGGLAMTVAEAHAVNAVCVWMGDEGDLFRETLPLAVLEPVEADLGEDDEEDEEDDEDGEEAGHDEASKVA